MPHPRKERQLTKKQTSQAPSRKASPVFSTSWQATYSSSPLSQMPRKTKNWLRLNARMLPLWALKSSVLQTLWKMARAAQTIRLPYLGQASRCEEYQSKYWPTMRHLTGKKSYLSIANTALSKWAVMFLTLMSDSVLRACLWKKCRKWKRYHKRRS